MLAFGITGCGGSDSSNEASLTKDQFINRADAICKEVQESVPKEFERYMKSRGLKSYRELDETLAGEGAVAVGVPAYRGQNEEIDELGTPKGDSGEASQFIEQYEEALDEAEDDFQVLLKPEVGPMKKVAEMAQDYGFATCGQTATS